jgi:type IV fimbrial biogenesis protein FimT
MQRGAGAGFTLIEMMVAIAILAVLMSLAVPSFRDMGFGEQLRSASTELIAAANLARSEAIKRNAPVNLCVSSDGESCGVGGWEQGWIVTAGGPDPIRVKPAAPSGFRISATGAATAIVFQPTGVGATPASFTICRATPSPGRQERIVTIDAAGRATARRTTTGVCP